MKPTLSSKRQSLSEPPFSITPNYQFFGAPELETDHDASLSYEES
jgi:hypothetical protein